MGRACSLTPLPGKRWVDMGNVQPEWDRTSDILGWPFLMKYDSAHGILYSSNWDAGFWALKVIPP